MTRRSGARTGVVARGKIRVDARRAVAQLREHLLVDLHLYALEVVRCAVAGGATAIDVRCDADDVWIAFDGSAFPPETFTRLLDYVLTDAEGEEGWRRRLLALAVNAALGLRPRHVDLHARAADGSFSVVRWTPALLDPDAKPPQARAAALRADLAWATTVVHVRTRAGWELVKKAALGRAPREISLLAGAAHELPVELTLAGEPFPLAPRPPALVRVPIEDRGLSRGFLEIVAPGPDAPVIEFLERGVLLARYGWSPGDGFPSDPSGRVRLPVRVVADAPHLPTNAARSTIREDAPILGLVIGRSREAFIEAVAALVARVTGAGAVAEGVEIAAARPGALEDALGAIAVVVAAGARRGVELSKEAAAVLDAPLLHDGAGTPIAPSALVAGTKERPLYAWSGKAPLPPDLAPWLADVIWKRGRVVEAILDGLHVLDSKEMIDVARQGLERRRRHLAHPPAEPEVPGDRPYLARTAFEVTEGDLAGLRGEVGVLPFDAGGAPGTTVRIHVEGRELDALSLDARLVPMPLDIALAWDGKLGPTFDYGGVARGPELATAIVHATRVAVLAADDLAGRLARAPDAMPDEVRRLLRAAVGTAAVVPERLGAPAPAERILTTCRRLAAARVWSTTRPERWASIDEIVASLSTRRALCFAAPNARGEAADGRLVLAVTTEEILWITAGLVPAVAAVPYDRALLDPARRASLEARRDQAIRAALERPRAGEARELGARLWFGGRGTRGLVAICDASRLTRLHVAHELSHVAFSPRYGAAAIAVDHDATVPTPAWDGVGWPPQLPGLEERERELCSTVVAAAEGDWQAANSLEGGIAAAVPVRYLIESAVAIRSRLGRAKAPLPDEEALARRIEALPLLAMLDERGSPRSVSLADIAEAHPAPAAVPVLERAPGFATLEWRPVILPHAGALTALGAWLGDRAALATAELPERAARAELEATREALMRLPEQDPRSVADLADPGAPSVHREVEAAGGGQTFAAGLLRAAPELDEGPWIDVLFRRRALTRYAERRGLPAVVRIGLSDLRHVHRHRELSEEGRAQVGKLAGEATLALALELIEKLGAAVFRDLRALRLIAGVLVPRGGEAASGETFRPLRSALRSAALRWPTVQGGEVPFAQLRRAANAIFVGEKRYEDWRRPTRQESDLDRPTLHLPSGPGGLELRRILEGLGVVPGDVTAGLDKLQARRAAASPGDAPFLSGAAAHPALRVSLASLGVTGADGELEIAAGPSSEVILVELGGARRVAAELPVPIRLVARVEELEIGRDAQVQLLKEITRASGKHLRALGPRLDELPPFVRDHLRAVVCQAVARERRVPTREARWPLFPDTSGAWHTLEALRADPAGKWRFTTSAPPYPSRSYGAPVLRLHEHEAEKLGAGLALEDVTAMLHQDLVGEVRAAAEPLATIALDRERRGRCLHVAPLCGGLEGEVGLLAAPHAGDRGISVHVGRRPLDLIDDGSGWPIAASLNRDDLVANRWFNGLEDPGAAADLARAVRSAANHALRSWLRPPPGALAVRYFGTTSTAGDAPVLVCGTLWLPPAWPRAPVVQLRDPLIAGQGAGPRALVAPTGSHLHGAVPVQGDLLIMPRDPGGIFSEAHWAAIAELARDAAASMLEEVGASGAAPAEVLDAYRWSLSLLGAAPRGRLAAPTADGKSVGAAAILDELARAGRLWWTRRAGTADGEFPGEAPRFVLADGPLVEVLRARLAPARLRELGGEGDAASPPAGAAAPPPFALEPAFFRSAPAQPDAAPASTLEAAAGGGAAAPSWLAGLVRRAVGVVRPPVSPAGDEDPFARALLGALASLSLTGQPVTALAYVDRGRPLSLHRKTRRIVVNRRHPAVVRLMARGPGDPRALALLAAAAVAEINRALEDVTDGEERRALEILLGRT